MSALLRILQLLPLIIEAIKAVEKLVPLGKQGPAKLETVLGVIEDTGADVQDLAPVITRVVNRVVGLANKTGTFQTTK